MSEMSTTFKFPEGVEFVEIATKSGAGYRIENGEIYGSPTHPYGPGAVVVSPATGYEFEYNVLDDVTRAVKVAPPAVTVHHVATKLATHLL